MEWVVLIAAIVLMAKVANIEQRSPWIWGGLTFLINLAIASVLDLPFLRIFFGTLLVFIIMTVVKMRDEG